MTEPIARLDLPGIKKFKSGKVREVFDLDPNLLIVATDRISAFDYILPTLIPHKGEILSRLSAFWFKLTKDIVENHYITDSVNEYPAELQPFCEKLQGRSMLVKRSETIPVECVVRGYISGSAWKEYQQSRTVCGERFGKLEQCGKFPQPIFTPATKADSGHDENIGFQRMVDIIGKKDTEFLKAKSIELYNFAHDHALKRGIIIADTKFEFGRLGDRLILIDEIFTPDSSRFWEASLYKPGADQPSYDKQFVRNYLISVNWDRNSPPPELPADIVEKTLERYQEALKRLAGITVE